MDRKVLIDNGYEDSLVFDFPNLICTEKVQKIY